MRNHTNKVDMFNIDICPFMHKIRSKQIHVSFEVIFHHQITFDGLCDFVTRFGNKKRNVARSANWSFVFMRPIYIDLACAVGLWIRLTENAIADSARPISGFSSLVIMRNNVSLRPVIVDNIDTCKLAFFFNIHLFAIQCVISITSNMADSILKRLLK